MEKRKWTRRQIIGSLAFVPLAANASASPLKTGVLSNVLSMKSGPSKMTKCLLMAADGKPLETSKMDRFYICDLFSRPFQIDPEFNPGEIRFMPATKPFRIAIPLEVPGFGEVFVYADNRGKGYTAESLEQVDALLLNYEFAADRLSTVKKLQEECQIAGIKLSSDTLTRINESEKLFSRCQEAKDNQRKQTKWAMESLRESLYAGEMIIVERAKHAISSRGDRPGFLFGCNAFRFKDYGSPHTKLFESLFNFATLPFYLGSTQKIYGKRDYSRVDPILEALKNTDIIPKGHPLIFLVPDSSPDWIKNKPYSEVKKLSMEYIHKTVRKYRDRIHIWDVINEAHVQPDIQYGDPSIIGYTKEQTIDFSIAASKAAREADPTCFRIINCTGTWGDYYMGRTHAPWQQNVYDYVTMLEDADCEYDALGLQYYHSGRDLLEFERDLDRFSRFNKPIHITELQIPSSSENIPGKDWWGGGAGGAGFKWHGDKFTETIQADWVEAMYTILYSKSFVDAITYWDMRDPSFVPHGGLVNQDASPKESYYRLKSLLDGWKSEL